MTLRQRLAHARKHHYAVGAFNAANYETLRAIFTAAKKLKSPIIIESSPGETDYIGHGPLRALVSALAKETGVEAYLNLDHATDPASVKKALATGFELVHFDGSEQPLPQNVRRLSTLAQQAHGLGRVIEGEMDHITGSSAPHLKTNIKTEQKVEMYTDPVAAAAFVKKTGIDILAVFIGNVHGVYAGQEKLDHTRLAAIRKAVKAHFSLHGGSGIPAAEVKRAIREGGIVKVNFNTELRVAYRIALDAALKKSKDVAIHKVMPTVIDAVQKIVEDKIRMVGSANR